MNKQIPVVYIFNSLSKTIETSYELIFDRVEYPQKLDGSYEHLYAVNFAKKLKYDVAENPNVVKHDHSHHLYTVWMREPDLNKAVELITDYIFIRIDNEIGYHDLSIKRLKAKRNNIEFFKSSTIKPNT